jgi:hypothetical protein
MEVQKRHVVLETDRYRIVGEITLPQDGYRNRFSDLLNQDSRYFIPVVNAEISPIDGGDAVKRHFVMVGRAQIEFAYELRDVPVATEQRQETATTPPTNGAIREVIR